MAVGLAARNALGRCDESEWTNDPKPTLRLLVLVLLVLVLDLPPRTPPSTASAVGTAGPQLRVQDVR